MRHEVWVSFSRRALAACVAVALLGLAPLEGSPFSASAQAATVRVDRSQKYQTIEGFGFFGARDAWWNSPAELSDPDWARMVIDDLGLSMWRNEYYPPPDREGTSDADWIKQRPVVLMLRDRAALSGVPLKVVLTIWSPPGSMKCASDRDKVHEGQLHPGGTRGGGAVCAKQRRRFAEWIIDGLTLYSLSGVEVYGLSFQNEPLFVQGYNSGRYPQAAYAETLAEIGPIIHQRFPKLILFGPETLLETEVGKNDIDFDPYWYTQHLLKRPAAMKELGAFALHAYTPSMLPTVSSKAARLWSNYHAAVSKSGRPTWMTETSGYVDAWEGGKNAKGEERPGAFDLAQAIYAALYYGKASAWLWWQGSESSGMTEFSLMQGTRVGKRYYASKQFYRYVRPGARMVRTLSDDPQVLAAAFTHERIGNFVSVLINGAKTDKTVKLVAEGVPAELDAFVTSASTPMGTQPLRVERDAIVLPARSIMTIVSGGYLDKVEKPGPERSLAQPSPAERVEEPAAPR